MQTARKLLASVPTDTQQQDREAALAAETQTTRSSLPAKGPSGTTYNVMVGVAAANSYVAVDELLPNRPLHVKVGDRVVFHWTDPHNVHSVVFPDDDNIDPSPVGFDCGPVYEPFVFLPLPGPPGVPCPEADAPSGEIGETILDPGNAAAGTPLRAPNVLIDSGVLIGRDYGARPIANQWSVTIDVLTMPGTYTFHCTIHDWMSQTITVG